MADVLMDYYLWIKAFHVIAMVAWMAGMLYLPRLYVYHVENVNEPAAAAMLVTMERRLLRFIINPAMAATFVLGFALIVANPSLMEGGWLHAKLTLVVGLVVVHILLARYRRQLAAGTCDKSAKFFRILNEIPTALMVGIILLVVLQPF